MGDTTFIWVRHFPVSAKGIYVGQSDIEAVVPPVLPCSLAGIQDAIWITSPLVRAGQTMNWIHESLHIQGGDVTVAPELMEQYFGHWEGQRYEDIQVHSEHPETIQPPEGEMFVDVSKRMHGWIEKALTRYTGKTVIAVCHAGAIRAALGHALSIPASSSLRFQMDYASLTQTRYMQHNGAFIGCVEKLNVPLITT